MSIESVMPSNHLLLPSIFPSIRVFSNESALHIRWWWTSFQICSLLFTSVPLCVVTPRSQVWSGDSHLLFPGALSSFFSRRRLFSLLHLFSYRDAQSSILSTFSLVLLLEIVLDFVFHPFDFFFLTILRFFSLQFLRTCPSSLICFSVASCSYLKAACLFLTLRQYLRLWYSRSLACWFVFQLGRPASLSCVRHFSNCDHLSPSSFLRMRHLQSLPACSEPASWWGSGAVVRRDLANAKESTSPPGVSQQRLASRCVLVGICHILSLKTPGSQLTHFWASKLWGPLWSYVIFVLTLCLYAFIAFIRLLIMLVSRERIDYQEEMINSIFQSAIFP